MDAGKDFFRLKQRPTHPGMDSDGWICLGQAHEIRAWAHGKMFPAEETLARAAETRCRACRHAFPKVRKGGLANLEAFSRGTCEVSSVTDEVGPACGKMPRQQKSRRSAGFCELPDALEGGLLRPSHLHQIVQSAFILMRPRFTFVDGASRRSAKIRLAACGISP